MLMCMYAKQPPAMGRMKGNVRDPEEVGVFLFSDNVFFFPLFFFLCRGSCLIACSSQTIKNRPSQGGGTAARNIHSLFSLPAFIFFAYGARSIEGLAYLWGLDREERDWVRRKWASGEV